MRLTEFEVKSVVDEAVRCFGPDACVTLFGSRIDDARRGGDIDLLVQGSWEREDAFRRKIRFLVALKSRIGDRRIDVVLAHPGDRRPIVVEARRTVVAL
jgi:predicted nucleotidyltransferase